MAGPSASPQGGGFAIAGSDIAILTVSRTMGRPTAS